MRGWAILPTLIVAVLAGAGCGGSSHPRVNPEVMLDSTRPGPTAQTQIDLRLQVRGVPRLSGPLRLRMEGGYVAGGYRRIPSFDLKFTANALGIPVDGEVVSTALNAYLSVYGDNYEVGPSAVSAANEWINRVNESGEPLDLQPRDWFGRARVEGESNEGGADCERIAAPLRAVALSDDIDALAGALGLASPPLVRGTIRGCVGFDDRVLHQFAIDAELGIPPADQQQLGGATSAHLELDVVNSNVGDQQEISKPGGGGYRPIRDLALSLNDLGVPIPL